MQSEVFGALDTLFQDAFLQSDQYRAFAQVVTQRRHSKAKRNTAVFHNAVPLPRGRRGGICGGICVARSTEGTGAGAGAGEEDDEDSDAEEDTDDDVEALKSTRVSMYDTNFQLRFCPPR